MLWFLLDVSTKLFPEIYHIQYIQSIESTVTTIVIPNWTCNDKDYTIFDFSRFLVVESIEIGDNSFGSVNTFRIEGLDKIEVLKIGKNSFTQLKESNWNICKLEYQSKVFNITNCKCLKSIEIGEFSFSDFGGLFLLDNLPNLQCVHIGKIGRKSYNFCYSSFVIRSMLFIEWYISRSFKSHVCCFGKSNILQFFKYYHWGFGICFIMSGIDLPELQSIDLGSFALYGMSGLTSSLHIQSIKNII